jgi:hypothetical protein
MDTVEAHPHGFPEKDWPFRELTNAVSFASAKLLSGSPVLLVYHDHDGDWQFLHGQIEEEDECVIICMGCAFQRSPSIGQLAQLPVGWKAYRESENDPWVTEPYEATDDEA